MSYPLLNLTYHDHDRLSGALMILDDFFYTSLPRDIRVPKKIRKTLRMYNTIRRLRIRMCTHCYDSIEAGYILSDGAGGDFLYYRRSHPDITLGNFYWALNVLKKTMAKIKPQVESYYWMQNIVKYLEKAFCE